MQIWYNGYILRPWGLKIMNNKAFSLSEMVSIIVVLGIIFAIIFPTTMSSFRQRTLNIQRKTFEEKFNRGMQEMRMKGKLAIQYASVLDFIKAMEDYFQISKVCDNNNLTECFPSDFTAKALYNDKETASKVFNTGTISDSSKLSSSFSDTAGDVAGVKFADGTSALMTLKPGCTGPDRTDVNGNVFQCIGYVADANGNRVPNTTGDDLLTNMTLINNWGLSFEISDVGAINGYNWYASKNYCENLEENGGGWKMPSYAQLVEIRDAIYGNGEYQPQYDRWVKANKEKVINHSLWDEIKLNPKDYNINTIYFFSSDTTDDNICSKCTNFNPTGAGYFATSRNSTLAYSLCVR